MCIPSHVPVCSFWHRHVLDEMIDVLPGGSPPGTGLGHQSTHMQCGSVGCGDVPEVCDRVRSGGRMSQSLTSMSSLSRNS